MAVTQQVPGRHDVELYRGDTLALSYRIVVDGVPLNLTNYTIIAAAKGAPIPGSTAVEPAPTPLPVTKDTVDLAVLTVTFQDAQTRGLPADSVYDVQLTAPGPAGVRTYVGGKLTLLDDVAR